MNYGVLTTSQRNTLMSTGKKLLRLRGDRMLMILESPEINIAGNAGTWRLKKNF